MAYFAKKLVFLLLIIPAYAHSQEIDNESLKRILGDWRDAVEQHVPGEKDKAAMKLANASLLDQRITITAIGKVLGKQLLAPQKIFRASNNDFVNDSVVVPRYRQTPFPDEGFVIPPNLIKFIAPSLRFKRDPGKVLKRAAILHTDLQVLGLTDLGGTQDLRIQLDDGHGTERVGGWHWKCARRLLDWSSSDPSHDEMILQWYIATTALQFSQRQWALVEHNLEIAQEYFPQNPIILFYLGVFSEINASPKIQRVKNAQLPRAFFSDLRNSELKLALQFYRQATEIDPKFTEAHLHLGRVMGLLGQHKAALAELRIAGESRLDPQLQYYHALFLGNELMALNESDEARIQFERAKKLYPNAQSPLLALSRLAHHNGDVQNAFIALDELFKLPGDDPVSGDDPWWIYDQSHARNSAELMTKMRMTFERGLQ